MHLRAIILALLLSALWPATRAAAERKATIVAVENGSVTADRETASEGETVKLTVTPIEGFRLKRGSLLVEKLTDAEDADGAQLTRGQVPGIGEYVSVTQVSDGVWQFLMPATDVEVRAEFLRSFPSSVGVKVVEAGDDGSGSQTIKGVTVSVSLLSDGTAAIDRVNVPEELSSTPLQIFLPQSIIVSADKSYDVSTVMAGAFMGCTMITDIHLPDTDQPLQIAEGAFLLDRETGDNHRIARIHTPLALLSGYALMTALGENYQAAKIQATATAFHEYWTFSCAVNVLLPNGVKMYRCLADRTAWVRLLEILGESVIKANNGVLLECQSIGANSYEMVVSPSDDRPSGMVPPTHNEQSYGENHLDRKSVV